LDAIDQHRGPDDPASHGPHHGHEDHDGHEHHHGHPHAHRGGLSGFLLSLLRPHSHDPGESVDSALSSSARGMRALKASLAGLAITAGVQLVVVLATGSVALLSDTIHNFADALTAVPLGLAFWLGRRPPNQRYTYGYGRSEDLAGVVIVATIAASCGIAAWEAVDRLVHPRAVHQIAWVMVAGLVGFVGNELVAVYRMRIGRRIGSAALVADGLHARTDGLTSLAVVAGAAGVAAGWRVADPVAGLVITVAILAVAWQAARDIYRRLMDAVDPQLVALARSILAEVEGIESVDALRIRWVGHELWAEAEVRSDNDLSLARAHAIAEDGRHRLLHEVRRLSQVTIHTSPCGHDGHDPHAVTAHHYREASTASTRAAVDSEMFPAQATRRSGVHSK